jgi:hypothetical protein
MNDRALHSAAELRARLPLTPVGEDVELSVLRGGETRTIRVRIAPLQPVSTGEGRGVPQLPGIRIVEIERGSPLSTHSRSHRSRRRGGQPRVARGLPARRHHLRRQPAADTHAFTFFSAVRGAERGYTVSLLRGDFNLSIVVC